MTIELQMLAQKRIALVAHDARKQDLLEWVRFNKGTLSHHTLYGTGTTGALVNQETATSRWGRKSPKVKSIS
jgi:methylglyoxal synthase